VRRGQVQQKESTGIDLSNGNRSLVGSRSSEIR